MAEYFPNEWEDDERMSVLMSDLPSKKESVSRQGRLKFWSSAIHSWILTNKILSFTLRDAEVAFQRGFQFPSCLHEVILDMLRKGEIVTEHQIVEETNNTWLAWSKKSLFIQPSQWVWKQLKQPFSYSNEMITYVDVSVLKTVADKFLNEYWLTDGMNATNITSMSSLHLLLSKFITKIEDESLIIQHLSLQKKASYIIHNDEIIVKIGSPGQVDVLPILEIEIASYRLKTTQKAINLRINDIMKEIGNCRDEAKTLLRTGYKKQALNKLRRKQILENKLESVSSTHDNLTACIDKLKESELNREVIGAFSYGLNALKKSVSSGGGPETVEDTLDDLKEILEECSDVTEIISNTVDPLNISEDDLEKELIALMESTNLEDPVEKPTLPDVPSNNPKISIESKAM